MGKKYDCLIFDLGNVVLGFDYNRAIRKLRQKSDVDDKKAHELFFDSDLTKMHDKGLISSRGFYKKVKNELGLKLGFGEFASFWNEIFFENKLVTHLIRKIKKNYRLLLLSNTNKLHFDYIKKKFDVIKLFDEIIVSYKAHALKPEPEIYKLAIKKARTHPNKILYTDDREDLVEAARSAHGIDAVIFKNAEDLRRILTQKSIL